MPPPSVPPISVAVIASRVEPNDGRLLRQLKTLADHGCRPRLLSVLNPEGVQHPVFAAYADAPSAMDVRLRPDAAPAHGGIAANVNRAARFALARRRVSAHLRATTPAVVLVHEPEALACVIRSPAAARARIVYDAHEFYESQRGAGPARVAWLRRVHAAAAARVDALITVSPGLRKLYADGYAWREPVTIVPNSAPPAPDTPYDGRLHRALGLEPHVHVLLFQGGLWPERGLEDLLEAAPLLPAPWRVVFLGGGPFAETLAASPHVSVAPPQPYDELWAWTRGAALGAIPYPDTNLNHRHCWPNKLWEYPANGVPILARDLPDVAEVVRAWGLGVLFARDGGGAAIAEALAGVADGAAAYRDACRRFAAAENWSVHQARFLDVIAGRAPSTGQARSHAAT